MIQLRSITKEQGPRFARLLEFAPEALEVYEQFVNPGQDVRDVLASLCSRGALYGYTRVGEEELLCLQGYYPMWYGVAEIWVAQTLAGAAATHGERNAMALRGIRLHGEMMESWHLHRIQTSSPVNSKYHERIARVAKLAGFDYEGRRKSYTVSGNDCDVWSLTRKRE